jgi:hypothetical protein
MHDQLEHGHGRENKYERERGAQILISSHLELPHHDPIQL